MKNRKSIQRRFAGILFFLFISGTIFAQTNFAGNWVFNESKSNFGDSQFRFAAAKMVVTQDTKVLSVESTMQGRDGNERKVNAKYNLDGSVSENPMFNSTSQSTVSWSADKKSMTIKTTAKFEMNGETREMKSSQMWTLGEDGKVLILDNVRTGRDGNEVKTKIAYDKK